MIKVYHGGGCLAIKPAAGRFQINDMTLIVCRGAGTWGPRMRLWLPGEILAMTLKNGG